MKRHIEALLLIVWFSLIASGALAQTADPPIYSYRNGDIWKYDLTSETATQLTSWGYNGGPILSPDGSKIVFMSSFGSDFVVDNLKLELQRHKRGGTAPANIWVMDVATETFTLIADQSGASAAGILRSLPSWSPDGRTARLAPIGPGPTSAGRGAFEIAQSGNERDLYASQRCRSWLPGRKYSNAEPPLG